MKRIILHIDMDYFFAQIEERENPWFKGRPVVVGADPKRGAGRGVVSTCNYEARKYGIHSALPISWAYKLCPAAVFLPVNMELYLNVSERIMEIVKKYSPVVEQVSLDEAYLDVSFLKNYKGTNLLAQKLKNEIFEKEKLTATVGIGPNKLLAKMASEKAKPNGLKIIKSAQIKNFLEPLDIKDLPGVGPKTAEKLRTFGVNKIKKLKNLSKSKLEEMFGKAGERIYERARGIDDAQVVSERVIKSIGKEHTFDKDTRDPEIIFKIFNKILEGVNKELVNSKVKTITVICRLSGFETHTKAKTFEKPSDDFAILQKEAKKLLLKFIVENKKSIRLIGLRVKLDKE